MTEKRANSREVPEPDHSRHVSGEASGVFVCIVDRKGGVLFQSSAVKDWIAPFEDAAEWLSKGTFFALKEAPASEIRVNLFEVLMGDHAKSGQTVLASHDPQEGPYVRFSSESLRGSDSRVIMAVRLGQDYYPKPVRSERFDQAVHELGSSLGAIQLAAENLIRSDLPGEAVSKPINILAATRKGHQALSVISEEFAPSFEKKETKVGPVFEDALGVFRRVLPDEIEFQSFLGGGDFPVAVAQVEVELALVEILAGVRSFVAAATPLGGKISAQLSGDSSTVVVEVSGQRAGRAVADQPPRDFPSSRALAVAAGGRFQPVQESDGSLTVQLILPVLLG